MYFVSYNKVKRHYTYALYAHAYSGFIIDNNNTLLVGIVKEFRHDRFLAFFYRSFTWSYDVKAFSLAIYISQPSVTDSILYSQHQSTFIIRSQLQRRQGFTNATTCLPMGIAPQLELLEGKCYQTILMFPSGNSYSTHTENRRRTLHDP